MKKIQEKIINLLKQSKIKEAIELSKEAIEEELEWLNQNEGYGGCNEVDVPEAKEGPSKLYIVKGIHIEIHKLPVL